MNFEDSSEKRLISDQTSFKRKYSTGIFFLQFDFLIIWERFMVLGITNENLKMFFENPSTLFLKDITFCQKPSPTLAIDIL